MERNKGLKARQEIMRIVIRACGGVTKVSKLMGNKNKQFAENWIQRGAVPFVLTQKMSAITSVHPALLNYEDYTAFHGYKLPWKDVLKASNLDDNVMEQLKKFDAPEIPEDLLWA